MHQMEMRADAVEFIQGVSWAGRWGFDLKGMGGGWAELHAAYTDSLHRLSAFYI